MPQCSTSPTKLQCYVHQSALEEKECSIISSLQFTMTTPQLYEQTYKALAYIMVKASEPCFEAVVKRQGRDFAVYIVATGTDAIEEQAFSLSINLQGIFQKYCPAEKKSIFRFFSKYSENQIHHLGELNMKAGL